MWSQRDAGGGTVLHWAVWAGDLSAAREWIGRFPASVDCVTDAGQTPLMWSVMKDETEETPAMHRFLVQAGASIDTQDRHGFTPLMLACQTKNRLAATFLVLRGAQTHRRDNQGATAAHWAAYVGCVGVLQLLQGRAVDLRVGDNDGNGPLHRAVQGIQTESVK